MSVDPISPKHVINLVVFVACIVFGIWLLSRMIGPFFVIGNNDTAPEVLGMVAYFLTPIPATLLALRHRKIAALWFVLAAGLLIFGVINDELYLQAQSATGLVGFDHRIDPVGLAKFLSLHTGPFFVIAIFFFTTDVMKWPKLLAALTNSSSSKGSA